MYFFFEGIIFHAFKSQILHAKLRFFRWHDLLTCIGAK